MKTEQPGHFTATDGMEGDPLGWTPNQGFLSSKEMLEKMGVILSMCRVPHLIFQRVRMGGGWGEGPGGRGATDGGSGCFPLCRERQEGPEGDGQ